MLTHAHVAVGIDNHRVIDPVATQVDAFNAHDLEAFLACFPDDAQVCDIDGTVQMLSA